MTKILKMIAGIDVAQDELVVTLGKIHDDLSSELFARKTFTNTKKGFDALEAWVKKQKSFETPVRFVMEATGVYHQRFAYHLFDKGYSVSIVLPNKIAAYMRTLVIKTVNDQTCADAITQFGLERKLNDWKRPDATYDELKELTRERQQMMDAMTVAKNQLHARNAQALPNEQGILRAKHHIAFLNKQKLAIEKSIRSLVAENQKIKEEVKLLCTIKGIAFLTAVTVLGETNGFDLVRNKKQLASYAGLDVREKQSGTSIKGKPRISKRGNKNLRKAMYMPSMAAIRHDERFKTIYDRLISRHGIRMKALIAIQRKLLEMTYTIFKTGKPYDENYSIQNAQPASNLAAI